MRFVVADVIDLTGPGTTVFGEITEGELTINMRVRPEAGGTSRDIWTVTRVGVADASPLNLTKLAMVLGGAPSAHELRAICPSGSVLVNADRE